MLLENKRSKTVVDIGYNHSDLGFDGNTCAVINCLGHQSPDIAQGVDRESPENQGAGDQVNVIYVTFLGFIHVFLSSTLVTIMLIFLFVCKGTHVWLRM